MGVFQFENPHFQELLRSIEPSTIEDLAIANTLGRPGAKLAQQDQIYLRNKRKGRDGIKYVHPALKNILGRTYGAIAFQEQVMAICNQVGGIPIAETNNIREAIKHFEHDVMESYKKKFIKGAIKNGVREDLAASLWRDIETHSSYSFNRNHATSYSLLGYYCMYLKVYYPIEYMTAMMNNDVGNEEQIRKYVRELKRLRIQFWIPEINHSDINYTIKKKNGKEGILCGFLSIKGIGEKTAIKIVDLRKQHGEKFLEYVPVGVLKKLGGGGFKLGGFNK
jgi:DNA polymerase-3 subunit alpha